MSLWETLAGLFAVRLAAGSVDLQQTILLVNRRSGGCTPKRRLANEDIILTIVATILFASMTVTIYSWINAS